VHAYSTFELTFDLHNNTQPLRLSLEPNHDILAAEGAYVEYLDKDGNVRHTEQINREAYKVFQGKSWILKRDGEWMNVGWARIVIRRDGIDPLFEGAFTIMGDHHHIQLRSNYVQTKHALDPYLEEDEDEYMAVFRDSDVAYNTKDHPRRSGLESSCSADKLEFNTNPNHPVFQQTVKRGDGQWGSMPLSSLFSKRQIDSNNPGGGNSGGVNLRSSIGNSAGCPSTRKVALIGVATDCTYTASFNSTDSVRQNVITQINSASDLYQSTFNITLGLRNLTVSDAVCPATAPSSADWNLPCTSSATIENRLNLFSGWRAQRQDTNAYWTLLSTCNTGAEVGLAWLGQLCNSGATTSQDTSGNTQQVSGANVVVRTSTEWSVIAHETGHTFGAVHDCTAQTCSDGTTVNAQLCCPLSSTTCDANGQYIMNPSAGTGISQFSLCTLGNICSALGRNSVQSSCLSENKGVTTITGDQCGNGIVEGSEECDCGGVEGCGTDSCCEPTTCKLKTGAVCDPTNDGCCTSTCQFAASGTVCRASTGFCDPQETCSGSNGTCPPDQTRPDGTSCGNSSQHLECASGQCTSRDLQCKTLMGSYTSDNDTYACNSQNFLDGTPCGGGGKCTNVSAPNEHMFWRTPRSLPIPRSLPLLHVGVDAVLTTFQGQCKGSTVGGEVKSWIDDNKPLVIGLSAGIGALLLLSILSCVIRCCRKPRKQERRHHRPRPRHTGGWDYDGPMPPAMTQRGGGGWVDSQNAGGWRPPTYAAPYYPPPSYGQTSVRYA
jgi:hypothetical protein